MSQNWYTVLENNPEQQQGTSCSSHINISKVTPRSHKKWPAVVACLMLIACIIEDIFQRWFVCLCRPTVTLHQGQDHRHEHAHHGQVYSHARFECNSGDTVWDMAITLQVKHLSSLRRTGDLEKEQGHRTEKKIYRPLVGWALLEQFLKWSNIYYFHDTDLCDLWSRSIFLTREAFSCMRQSPCQVCWWWLE